MYIILQLLTNIVSEDGTHVSKHVVLDTISSCCKEYCVDWNVINIIRSDLHKKMKQTVSKIENSLCNVQPYTMSWFACCFPPTLYEENALK